MANMEYFLIHILAIVALAQQTLIHQYLVALETFKIGAKPLLRMKLKILQLTTISICILGALALLTIGFHSSQPIVR